MQEVADALGASEELWSLEHAVAVVARKIEEHLIYSRGEAHFLC